MLLGVYGFSELHKMWITIFNWVLTETLHQFLVDLILNQSLYGFADGPKDTSPDDTLEKTYVPSLKTLEEEVMEKLGIQEQRRPRTSYWY